MRLQSGELRKAASAYSTVIEMPSPELVAKILKTNIDHVKNTKVERKTTDNQAQLDTLNSTLNQLNDISDNSDKPGLE